MNTIERQTPEVTGYSLLVDALVAAIIVILFALCSGCSGMAGMARELKDDPAIVAHQISTIYGTSKFVRVGGRQTNSTVSVSPDGTVTVHTP